MIIELICTPLMLIVKGFIAILPVLTYLPNSIVSTLDMILKAMQFFPADVWFMVIRKYSVLDYFTTTMGDYKFYIKINTIFEYGAIGDARREINMFKKDILKNKHLKYLRQNVFNKLEMSEFIEVYTKFKRLKMQYRFLKIAEYLEEADIPIIEVPIIRFITKLISFIRWKLYDLFMVLINGRLFNLFGVSIFCGRQGSGKTIGIVEELERVRNRFPEAIICTNIHYIHQDLPLVDWRQLLEIRNGIKGVVFVIDEIQNEYDNSKWKDFPDGILSVITQQRKQRIKIYLSSQVYTRVVKQIREQCFDVIECKTFLGRWTRLKCYDAEDYNSIVDNPDPKKKFKLPKKWRRSFIQSNMIRNLYDSYKVVETMQKEEFIPRNERST